MTCTVGIICKAQFLQISHQISHLSGSNIYCCKICKPKHVSRQPLVASLFIITGCKPVTVTTAMESGAQLNWLLEDTTFTSRVQ